jgi:hypothetical protein
MDAAAKATLRLLASLIETGPPEIRGVNHRPRPGPIPTIYGPRARGHHRQPGVLLLALVPLLSRCASASRQPIGRGSRLMELDSPSLKGWAPVTAVPTDQHRPAPVTLPRGGRPGTVGVLPIAARPFLCGGSYRLAALLMELADDSATWGPRRRDLSCMRY